MTSAVELKPTTPTTRLHLVDDPAGGDGPASSAPFYDQELLFNRATTVVATLIGSHDGLAEYLRSAGFEELEEIAHVGNSSLWIWVKGPGTSGPVEDRCA